MGHKKMWKILEEMGLPDHFACLLRNLYVAQKQHLEPDMKSWAGSNLGKKYIKAVFSYATYLTCMQSTLCEMHGWMNHKLESNAGRNINNLRCADNTTLMAENKEELKNS